MCSLQNVHDVLVSPVCPHYSTWELVDRFGLNMAQILCPWSEVWIGIWSLAEAKSPLVVETERLLRVTYINQNHHWEQTCMWAECQTMTAVGCPGEPAGVWHGVTEVLENPMLNETMWGESDGLDRSSWCGQHSKAMARHLWGGALGWNKVAPRRSKGEVFMGT
jgi:hypothetical protein